MGKTITDLQQIMSRDVKRVFLAFAESVIVNLKKCDFSANKVNACLGHIFNSFYP
jgi:hypothetical protein